MGDLAVTTDAMEAKDEYWQTLLRALEGAGIRFRLVHAQQVDSWELARPTATIASGGTRVEHFRLVHDSQVPPRLNRELSLLSRQREEMVRNHFQKGLCYSGIRLGGVINNQLGTPRRTIWLGLAQGRPRGQIHTGTHTRDGRQSRPHRSDVSGRPRRAQQLTAHRSRRSVLRAGRVDQQVAGAAPRAIQRPAGTDGNDPQYRPLQAGAVLVELGPDSDAFGNAQPLASFAGVRPTNKESSSKRWSGLTRWDSRWIRTTLIKLPKGHPGSVTCRSEG